MNTTTPPASPFKDVGPVIVTPTLATQCSQVYSIVTKLGILLDWPTPQTECCHAFDGSVLSTPTMPNMQVFIGCGVDSFGTQSVRSIELMQPRGCGTPLFPSFEGIPQLRKIIIDGCHMDGAGINWQSLLSFNPMLQFITVTSSFMGGTIDAAIGAFPDLEEIRLDANTLQGTVPESISKLSKLRVLSVANNGMLGGPLPSNISQLTKLVELSTQGTRIHGPIPSIPTAKLMKCQLPNGVCRYSTSVIPAICGNITVCNLNDALIPDVSIGNKNGGDSAGQPNNNDGNGGISKVSSGLRIAGIFLLTGVCLFLVLFGVLYAIRQRNISARRKRRLQAISLATFAPLADGSRGTTGGTGSSAAGAGNQRSWVKLSEDSTNRQHLPYKFGTVAGQDHDAV
ncbi:hypothetical protein HDU76_000146 [Blyttiomyces sp. JEL0837]|nr:hypothetical protein HDU76_000146 [Blyttiomyces sp. JEL0837]